MNHKYNSMASVTVLYITADRKKNVYFTISFFLMKENIENNSLSLGFKVSR